MATNQGQVRIIRASAGAGKTYNLAQTYIKYLLGRKDGDKYVLVKGRRNYHQHLLAITFTNAATDEMKKRIVKELELLSLGRGDFVRDFKTEFRDDISLVQQAASVALADILFNYSQFHVSTIDSFFQQILRAFTFELDRDAGYDLQLDEVIALQSSIHDFLLSLGRNASKDINDWVAEYVNEKVSGDKDWNVFNAGERSDFLEVSKNLNKEVFRKNGDKIMAYMADMGNGRGMSRLSRFRQLMRQSAERWDRETISAQERLVQFIHGNDLAKGLNGSRALHHLIQAYRPGQAPRITDTFKKITIDNIAEQFVKSAKDAISPDTYAQLVGLITDVCHGIANSQLCQDVGRDLARLGIMGQVLKYLDIYRRDNNVLLITDTNELIRRVIHSGVPFVFEHTGTWFNNYLIDEFQDTSEMQYDNFRVLIDESVDQGNESLIIGDEKQSIYRFRNSNPDLLRETIGLDYAGRSISKPLLFNWRTFKEVVNFNNQLFTHIRDAQALTYPRLASTYKNVFQEAKRADISGYVHIEFSQLIDKATKKKKNDNTKVGISKEDFQQDVLSRLPELIDSIKQRGFRHGDIAILVNTRAEGNEVVETILNHNLTCDSAHTIKVVSGESLLLKNSVAVKIVISVLRFLENNLQLQLPADGKLSKEQRARVTDRLFYILLREFEHRLRISNDSDKGEVLKQSIAFVINSNKTELTSLHDQKDYLPDPHTELSTLGNVVDKIIRAFVLSSASKTEGEISYLLALQDTVSDFESRGSGTIREFLRFWDTKKDKLSVNSGAVADAVNVMTIHKSKGLEFPCVIIPFVNWEVTDIRNNTLWVESQRWISEMSDVVQLQGNEALVPPIMPTKKIVSCDAGKFLHDWATEEESTFIDSLNKTYVAFTRPKQELHAYVLRDLKDDSIATHILSAISKMDMSHSQDSIGRDIYCLGEPSPLFKDKKKDSPAIGSEGNPIPMKLSHIQLFPQSADRIKVRIPQTDRARLRGEHLHALFSHINSSLDAERALNFCLSRGYLSPDAVNKWRQQLQEIFSDPKTAPWYDPDNIILNERAIITKTEISTPEGTVKTDTENKRPDRIILRPDGTVIVVDYKFGDIEKRSYEKQVRAYSERISQALNRPTQGYVWYVNKNKIVTVST